MSAVASWSYTAKATLWPLLSRSEWSGAQQFGAPQTIACDYSQDARVMTDAKGDEFTTRLVLFTERAGIKQGDRVALGVLTEPNPAVAGALEVRHVLRQADVFDRVADDYQVAT